METCNCCHRKLNEIEPNERRRVEELGQRVLEQLGEGWRCNVFHNINWYVSWHNGYISVHECGGRFFALVDEELNGVGGLSIWTESGGSYKDPNEAVRAAVNKVRETVAKYNIVLDALNKICPLRKSKG